jgi:hypothetical protein
MKKKTLSPGGWESEFRRYKILVKTFRKDQVEQRNLEIFTTGLKQLLEMRKIHQQCFESSAQESFEPLVRNN